MMKCCIPEVLDRCSAGTQPSGAHLLLSVRNVSLCDILERSSYLTFHSRHVFRMIDQDFSALGVTEFSVISAKPEVIKRFPVIVLDVLTACVVVAEE